MYTLVSQCYDCTEVLASSISKSILEALQKHLHKHRKKVRRDRIPKPDDLYIEENDWKVMVEKLNCSAVLEVIYTPTITNKQEG